MVVKYDFLRHIGAGRFGRTALVRRAAGGAGSDAAGLAVLRTLGLAQLGGPGGGALEEVVALARLRHPYLVETLEVFQDGGILCVMTEYADDGHVAARIARARSESRARIDERLALHWLAQALLALRYVHDRGALHRDLRARRLLLCSRGNLLVSGLVTSAALARKLAPDQPDIEALRYLSPELVAGNAEHGRSTDMWAVGVILFELLALRAPHEDENPRVLAAKILGARQPPLSPSCHSDLRRVCLSLLCREPGGRPAPAEVLQEGFMQEHLRRLLNSEPRPEREDKALPMEPVPGAMLLPKPPRFDLAPQLLGTPRPTARALRRAGEAACGGGRASTAREQAGPRAATFKRGGLAALRPVACPPPLILPLGIGQPPGTANTGYDIATPLAASVASEVAEVIVDRVLRQGSARQWSCAETPEPTLELRGAVGLFATEPPG